IPGPRGRTGHGTHLAVQLLPTSFQDEDHKVIACNHKDVVVSSSYFFCQMSKMLPDPDMLGEFLETFMAGKSGVAYGSWCESEWGWWEKKQKEQLLSLFCEDMKKMKVVQGMVVRILHHTSFGDPRKNPAANWVSLSCINHFTVTQNGPALLGAMGGSDVLFQMEAWGVYPFSGWGLRFSPLPQQGGQIQMEHPSPVHFSHCNKLGEVEGEPLPAGKCGGAECPESLDSFQQLGLNPRQQLPHD
uniref:Sulfotransferase n=1 Tax=Strigops habroptila TaxID=2489341 RepID=A0A672UFF9_STRHB